MTKNPDMTIEENLQKNILVLDGAMGTMIQKHNLKEEDYKGERFKNHPCALKGNNDLLSITHPEIIKKIHCEYLKAGADIIETNTFSSTSIAMADYQMEDLAYELNYESAKIAREAAQEYSIKTPNRPRYAAGSIGPTNKTASMSPDVNDPGYRAVDFDQLAAAYREQVTGLIDGGADILLVETIFDTLNAKAALYAIDEIKKEKEINIPVMVSGTITDASGRTLSGQTIEAFNISLSHISLLSIGLNCALGANQLLPHIKTLANQSPLFISAHPNAGLPNAFGEYDQSPEEMKILVQDYLEQNLVNIIGGCCGTTPEHISLIADLARKFSPREPKIFSNV